MAIVIVMISRSMNIRTRLHTRTHTLTRLRTRIPPRTLTRRRTHTVITPMIHHIHRCICKFGFITVPQSLTVRL